ncbi:hypothetical protein SSAG_01220 [Streptomyces sp. Mg1]|nr:hypothetical protein SSAG_01220 [Streptomyces sp. Mg1]
MAKIPHSPCVVYPDLHSEYRWTDTEVECFHTGAAGCVLTLSFPHTPVSGLGLRNSGRAVTIRLGVGGFQWGTDSWTSRFPLVK